MDKWLYLSIRSFLWYDGGADEKECKNEIIEGNEKVAQRKVFTKKQKYYKIAMAYAKKQLYQQPLQWKIWQRNYWKLFPIIIKR